MLFVVFFVFLALIVLIAIFIAQREHLGVLRSKRVYSDTENSPGEVLYATTINLCGKPDYIIKENGTYIPVEIKTGKTPDTPYQSHQMQLMAYCYLVEENFDVRVPGGIIRYPEKEFRVRYTDLARDSVRGLVAEITDARRSNTEFFCTHEAHTNLSKK